MQIPSFSASAQIILSGSSQNIDGSRVQSPDDGTQVTGSSGSSAAVQPAAQSLDQVTAPKQEAAIQTKVVTAADETLGTSLGLNIDTTA